MEKLEWWLNHLQQWKESEYSPTKHVNRIRCLPDRMGCNNVQTGGPWSPEEQGWHINCLEIQAANLAVRTFAKDKSSILILLLVDNTTAVSYINHLGGTVSPLAMKLVKNLCTWCMERNIMLKAQHLPGIENTIADRESRTLRDMADWMLNPLLFKKIQTLHGHSDNRLVCISSNDTIAPIFQLETRSPGSCNRCSDSELVGDDSICQPSLESAGQSPSQISTTPLSGIITDSSSMAKPTPVSSFTGLTNRLPTFDTTM